MAENDVSWAMKLLDREPDEVPNLLAANWAYICAPIAGMAIPASMNVFLRRPAWAGIHRHMIFAAAGFVVGHFLTKRDEHVHARRDAILRDYIRLHPEDFPEPKRIKIGDVFESWNPIR